MYKTCPKCSYQRQQGDIASPDICPACGLVFAKWERYQNSMESVDSSSRIGEMSSVETEHFADRIIELEAATQINPATYWGRVAVYLLLFAWGWYFIFLKMESNAIGYSFMHNIDLVFHEAGHVLFRPFGDFMMVLGGSLMQMIMPLIVAGTFLFKQHDSFGASVGIWWLGQSMMDIAPYINDARAMELQLVGGGTGRDRPGIHDWNNLLWDLGMLPKDHAIARTVDTLGEITVMLALAWGGYVLFRQFRQV
jgi:hypothetical protein